MSEVHEAPADVNENHITSLNAADLSDWLYEVESELCVVYCACDGPDRIDGALVNGVMRVLARQIRAVRELKNAVDAPEQGEQ